MEVDTSWPVGVRGRGMSEECLLPSLPARVRPWAYRNKGHPTAIEITTAVIGEPRTEAHIRLGGMILLVLHAPVGRWITG